MIFNQYSWVPVVVDYHGVRNEDGGTRGTMYESAFYVTAQIVLTLHISNYSVILNIDLYFSRNGSICYSS